MYYISHLNRDFANSRYFTMKKWLTDYDFEFRYNTNFCFETYFSNFNCFDLVILSAQQILLKFKILLQKYILK